MDSLYHKKKNEEQDIIIDGPAHKKKNSLNYSNILKQDSTTTIVQ